MRKYLVILALVLIFAQAQAQAQAPGIGIDAKGGPVIDPTKNVLDLVTAAIQRQDDLRAAAQTQLLLQIAALKDKFQAQLDAADKLSDLRDRRTQDLSAALASKLQAEAELRAKYEERLASIEKARIDAIRAVDATATAFANQRTAEQATSLQKDTTTQAENLRGLVATTASTALTNQQQQFAAISARLTTLEQALAAAAGSAKYQDPALADLARRVELLAQRQTTVTGQTEGSAATIAYVIAIVMGLIALGGLIATVIAVLKKHEP